MGVSRPLDRRVVTKLAIVAIFSRFLLYTSKCGPPSHRFVVPLTQQRAPRRGTILRGIWLLPAAIAMPPLARAELAFAGKVESFPPFNDLVALYGIFDLAFESCKFPGLQRRFATISHTDLDSYRYLCENYTAAIRYEDPYGQAADYDRGMRLKACTDAIASLANARRMLQHGVSDVEAASLQREVIDVVTNLGGFFARLDNEDVDSARVLSRKLSALDLRRNGSLLNEDFQKLRLGDPSLSSEDRDVIAAMTADGSALGEWPLRQFSSVLHGPFGP
mmetsp:Transcript_32596/g.89938  ORF Transcript_32596/g.89938 Transcript_32596/m.89938 type:complete len:277 (+) Transcript_32596:147-977(+)